MTYEEQLSTEDWQLKRNNIIRRDKAKCTICSNFKLYDKKEFGVISGFRDCKRGIIVEIDSKFRDEFTVFIPKKLIEPRSTIAIFDYHTKGEKITKLDNSQVELNKDFVSIIALGYLKEDNQTVYFFNDNVDDTIKSYLLIKDFNIVDYSYLRTLNVIYIKGLHVHHKYYQDELLPWEYPNDALTTLCWHCHKEFHENGKVRWLDKNGLQKSILTNCTRCYGAGVFPEYKHVNSGICFQCHGAKYKEFI